ncbi:MAG: hypothetical protein AAB676_05620 [Verrucomicrobiota bacterium]
MNSHFAAWALHPRRSREERFGAELLIENTLDNWRRKHGLEVHCNWEEIRLRKKERSLNPAYEPQISLQDAERVEEVLGDVKSLDFRQWYDRPLRDLSVIQFCPALEKLDVWDSEIRDWSALLALPELRELHVAEKVGHDFRVIAQLAQLKVLYLRALVPWPDLTGFERLTALSEFEFCGNILALGVIPRLTGLRAAKFHQWVGSGVPLRRVSDLPEMPELRRLYLENTWRLDGIERSPWLLNLEVYGYFDDLSPLAALRHLTHVTVSGGEYKTLQPLAELPELRRAVIRREEPQDCTPLAEAPHLHEIAVELCPVQTAELATLNAMLVPWSEEFAVEPLRPLPPLCLVIRDHEAHAPDPPAQARDWGEDLEMAASESRWFARQVNGRLTALLGRGWGKVSEYHNSYPGSEHVEITRREDIDRLREIVECLRQLLASARYKWCFWLCVDSLAPYERDLEEIARDTDEFDAERERADWEYRRQQDRERREYLEREYRYRLRQEQGLPTRPEDFAPPPPPADGQEETVAAGSAVPEPPEYDLGTELSLHARLTETTCSINERDRGLAELLLEIKAEQ